MKYQLIIEKRIKKDLRRIPKLYQDKIMKMVFDLKKNPYPTNSKRLKNIHKGYRLKIGRYRVIYTINKQIKIVLIVKVAHRKDIYRELNF